MRFLWMLCVVMLFVVPSVSAAHFIVGLVSDARDGTVANGHTVVLWKNGDLSDNLTDIIGPAGDSNVDNVYLFDCELLTSSCVRGDNVSVMVVNNGSRYSTLNITRIVNGTGFDIMPNLTLNSPPRITSLVVDDALATPAGEIDLTAASTRTVTCSGVVTEYDGNETLVNASSEFFDTVNSLYGGSDDNNDHYTNSSCTFNLGFGNENQSSFSCEYEVAYYANSQTWNCTVQVFDDLPISTLGSNTTLINPLLAIELPDSLDFGLVNATEVSQEIIANVTNFGNVEINLTLEGYARTQGDQHAFNCSLGSAQNISVYYQKFNLTGSNPGTLNLAQFESLYVNLTNMSTTYLFSQAYRQNDTGVNITNATYWRAYVPIGVAGTCTGNIVFGATQGPV